MKITIFIPTYIFKSSYLRETEIECVGTGDENDPVIIEPSENLPLSFVVRNSSLFIVIRNVDIYNISLRMSRNIVVKDCKLTNSHLANCSTIEYRNTIITKFMPIYNCNNIQVKDCKIGKLKFYQSNSNVIKNCTIAKIKTTRSNDNIFESISLPEAQLNKLEKTRFGEVADRIKLKSLVVSLIIFFLVVILLPKLAFNTYMELPLIFILLGVFVFLFYFSDVIRLVAQKRTKRTS
jgi:hypothetical protein